MNWFWQTLVLAISLHVLTCHGAKRGREMTARMLEADSLLPSLEECGKWKIASGARVFGGRPAELGELPWMASIGTIYQQSWISWGCGGSLVTQQHVITAAHCFPPNTNARQVIVRLGDLDLNQLVYDGAQPFDFGVEKIIVNKHYDSDTMVNDIATIKLNMTVEYTDFIKPICLPLPKYNIDITVGDSLTVAGWGLTERDLYTKYFPDGTPKNTRLMTAENEIKDVEECSRNYIYYRNNRLIINENHICASGEDSSACFGDSGGPLMFYKRYSRTMSGNRFLMGVVSHGPPECLNSMLPVVYTNVVPQMPWIMKSLNL